MPELLPRPAPRRPHLEGCPVWVSPPDTVWGCCHVEGRAKRGVLALCPSVPGLWRAVVPAPGLVDERGQGSESRVGSTGGPSYGSRQDTTGQLLSGQLPAGCFRAGAGRPILRPGSRLWPNQDQPVATPRLTLPGLSQEAALDLLPPPILLETIRSRPEPSLLPGPPPRLSPSGDRLP